MIMPMEGTHYESREDAEGTDAALEPTHTESDEFYYVHYILTGEHDEADEDMRELDWYYSREEQEYRGYR